jgi:RND family efflux transporter MFP subunit
MSHLRSINPAIAALLLLAAGLGVAALSLTGSFAGGGKPHANPINAVKAQPASVEPSNRNSERPVELIDPASSSGEFVGMTIAREAIEVGAPSEGRLEAVYVNLGDRLKPGDRIARLNSDSINRQLAMARASLQAAEADERRTQLVLAEAEDRCSRRRTLADEGLLSREEVVSAELQVKMAVTNMDAAKARVSERQAQVAQIEESLSNAELRAPFAGTVAARLANPGSTVHPGSPVISLIREGDLWIRFAAPQERLAAVNIGSVIDVNIDAFSSGDVSATTAVVEHVSPTVDAVSQLFFVEARLKIPAAWRERIRPGLTARCEVAR